MSKSFISFLMIALSISALNYSMDQANKIKNIILRERIHSVEFIGNEAVIINKIHDRPTIVVLESGKEKLVPKKSVFTQDWSVVADKKQKRILFEWRDNNDDSFLNICDEVGGDHISRVIMLAKVGNKKKCTTVFDETEPTSILICTNNNILFFDYSTRAGYPNEHLSKALQDNELNNFRFGFNNEVGNYIVGQYNRGFKIFFDVPGSINREREVYKLPFGTCNANYRCSSDMSFIAYYSENCHPYLINSFCSIFNLKTGKVFLLSDNAVGIKPCSMEIHPNDKVVVTMSTPSRNVHYWQASTGKLLSEHKASDEDKGDFLVEVGALKAWLSFSADGRSLFAVYPKRGINYQVPIEALWGKTRGELIDTWCCLQNSLPQDVVKLIIGMFE